MSGIRTESNQMVIQTNGVDACFAKNTGVLAAGAPGVGGNDCAVVSQVLGVGQTWQDLTGSRAIGTTYTNNTGKPITVNVLVTSTLAGAVMRTIVGGLQLYGSATQAVGGSASIIVIVPNGATYSANISAGTPTLIFWAELR